MENLRLDLVFRDIRYEGLNKTRFVDVFYAVDGPAGQKWVQTLNLYGLVDYHSSPNNIWIEGNQTSGNQLVFDSGYQTVRIASNSSSDLPLHLNMAQAYGIITAARDPTMIADVDAVREPAEKLPDDLDAAGDPCLPTPWAWLICSIELPPRVRFSYLAFSATAAFMQHLVLYFWNRFEVPALHHFLRRRALLQQQGLHITSSAILTSAVQVS
ncbi:hypothetical protein R1flu_020387 [Riccia fluitans]|uniref:Uncharacterized protein n=1 Tax=Riccia fluitans TaxID=41844 RepID=A0ABD1ZLD5_9MARC